MLKVILTAQIGRSRVGISTNISMSELGANLGIFRIDPKRFGIKPARFIDVFRVPILLRECLRPVTLKRQIVSRPGTDRFARDSLYLGIAEMGDDDRDNRLRDLVLNGEDVA